MEMAWNPIVVVTDLRLASQILSDRCLKLSAKWCAEQWMGLPPEVVVSAAATSAAVVTRLDEHSSLDAVSTTTISEKLLLSTSVLHQHDPAVQYSKAVFELGEYAHAAAILSETSLQNKAASVEIMPPPLPGLSPNFAFDIGGTTLPGGITTQHVADMAEQINIGPRFALGVASDLAGKLPVAVAQAHESIRPSLTPRDANMAARLATYVDRLVRQSYKRMMD